MRTSIALPLAALAGLAFAPGCLTVSDDHGPTLSVEIFWDAKPDSSDAFRGSDCYGAKVDRMEWALWRGSNDKCSSADEDAGDCRPADPETDGVESFVLWTGDQDNCRNAIDVIDPGPGVYELDLTGMDADGAALWKATCSGLTLLRFDVAYECDVPAP